MNVKEEFRDISGYEGRYKVSNLGNVKSLPRSCIVKRKNAVPYEYQKEEILLEQNNNGRGYPHVSLCTHGKNKSYAVHRLVGEAFLGPKPEGMETRHKDGNRTNNQLSNLCYGTSYENSKDCIDHGTQARGEKMGSTTRSNEEIRAAKQLLKTKTNREVSRITGIPETTLSYIKNGLRWAHV